MLEKLPYLSWFSEKEIRELNLYALVEKIFANKKLSNANFRVFLKYKDKIERCLTHLKLKGVNCKTILDKDYPQRLRDLTRPPLVLSYIGNYGLLSEADNVAIVGSRKLDEDLVSWLELEFQEMRLGRVTISGGAYGVDQIVHKSSFVNGIKTIIVIPSGILKPYPQNLEYFIEKAKNSKSVLILSIFSPKEEIRKWNFHPRNNVLAILSEKIFIIKAQVKSGTMVTAKYAIDHNKDLRVLPGFIWSKAYGGNTRLLSEGATPLFSLSD